jgi:hypothetical protein
MDAHILTTNVQWVTICVVEIEERSEMTFSVVVTTF